MQSTVQIKFANDVVAKAIEIKAANDLPSALAAIGLPEHRPVLVIIGGASLIAEADFAKLQTLFVEVLAPLAQNLGCYVVDGGTDTGVMKLMGNAKNIKQLDFPLIGVLPIGLVKLPHGMHNLSPNVIGSNPDAPDLEPHHSHFFWVQGNQWGDESRWLAHIASLLAGEHPSVTVLINGGAIALVDAKESAKEQRPIVTIAGSGRLADEIANATLHPDWEQREEIESLLTQGQIHLFDLAQPIYELETVLRQKLSGEKL